MTGGRALARKISSWIAATVIVGLLVTFAVIVDGFDARETPRDEAAVWVTRGDHSQYGRVNTLTGEIDAVRAVEAPSQVIQHSTTGVMLTRDRTLAWSIDAAQPEDLVESEVAQDASTPTHEGTDRVMTAGQWTVTLTKTGNAYVSTVDTITSGTLLELDGESYPVAAAAVTAGGDIAVYSSERDEVRRYSATRQRFEGRAAQIADTVADPQLAIVGKRWVLLDTETATVYQEGEDPLDIREAVPEETGTVKLQRSDAQGEAVVIATTTGLWEISDTVEQLAEAAGMPAQPVTLEGQRLAAWAGTSAGTLWRSTPDGAGETVSLDYDSSVTELTEPTFEFHVNGSHAVLNETNTGMLWTVPDGSAIPLVQWGLFDNPQENTGEVEVEDVTDPEPPVAVSDTFGARAGQATPLPVLLNDYDPNRRDVLTIVPESLSGLDPEFGDLRLLPDGQSLILYPAPGASGSAQFSYQITDGQLVSGAANVTVNIAADSENTAPQWCPVEGCQRSWPAPEMTPGGTLVTNILDGWVDPQGDPMILESAVSAQAAVRAVVTDDGKLAIRDSAARETEVTVALTVADSRGERTTKDLLLRITSGASMSFEAAARSAQVGATTTVDPLSRVTGGSGSYGLVDATSSDMPVSVADNTIRVVPEKAGTGIMNVTVRDLVTDQETTGIIRVTAVEDAQTADLPPLKAFVRPLSDTTVDVLAALPRPVASETAVASVTPYPAEGSELTADTVEHSLVRLAGQSPPESGDHSYIGKVAVGLRDSAGARRAEIHVFSAPEVPATGGIAVGDSATVRAGSVVDIAVLANDVAPPGERLVLDPEISTSEEPGELAFASGQVLRYLAPNAPGTYTLTYRVYNASNPEIADTAQVRVTVLPPEGNANPTPATVTARVEPGQSAQVAVPLSGVDPDGDRVRIVGVATPTDSNLTVEVRNGLTVYAAATAEPGTHRVSYTVRDRFGGQAQGTLNIVVTPASDQVPVVYSDYVRLSMGVNPVTVRPLANDLDPAGGVLEIVEIEPNLLGGKEHPAYRNLVSRIDTSDMAEGIARIAAGDSPGTVSYRYTVKSSATNSTADGLIVVQTSERVGVQAPSVEDTVLSVADRTRLTQDGVDVMTDKIRWSAGDVSTLKLSLWGTKSDSYTVTGNRIRGEYNPDGDLVPFAVSGTDVLGAEVTTYGFLIVPPLDELRLSLVPGFVGLTVDEDSSVTVPLSDVIASSSGDRLEFAETSLPVRRSGASCVIDGDSVTYTAGRGAPWRDQCAMQVRIAGQSSYTQLHIPVQIQPTEPVATLRAMTRTLPPGATDAIDLTEMLSWEGGREGDPSRLSWSVTGSPNIRSVGPQAEVSVPANLLPGSVFTADVTVTGARQSTATLTVRVGQAPRATPRGGAITLNCTVGDPSCGARAVGIPGEYDPFAGQPGGGLNLVSVNSGSCAAFGTLGVAGDRIEMSWAGAEIPGGVCSATFAVTDSQGRHGTGTIELDARGLPQPPVSVTQTGYTATTVDLQVTLPSEAAYPEVTSIVLKEGGSVVGSCELSGRCTVTGLVSGQQHSYTAHARNAVGESAASPTVTAWAFQAPQAPTVTATQETFANGGGVQVSIRGGSDIRGYELTVGPLPKKTVTGANVDERFTLPAGTHRIVAVPLSRNTPPIGPGSGGSGGSAGGGVNAGETTVTVKGAPTNVTLTQDTSTTSHLRVTVSATGDGPIEYGYRIADGACTYPGGDTFNIPGTAIRYNDYTITPCAKNEWGEPVEGQAQTFRVGKGVPLAPPANPSIVLASGGGDVWGQDGNAQFVTSIVSPASDVQLRAGGSTWLAPEAFAAQYLTGKVSISEAEVSRIHVNNVGAVIRSAPVTVPVRTPPRVVTDGWTPLAQPEDARQYVAAPYRDAELEFARERDRVVITFPTGHRFTRAVEWLPAESVTDDPSP